VPAEYIKELSKLQDSVEAMPFEKIDPVLIKGWTKDWRQKFKNFDESPIAAASISQVYKARLKDGSKVAVKIQKPGVKEEVNADLNLLLFVSRFVERHYDWAKSIQPSRIVQEFSKSFTKELDFKREAIMIEKFRYNSRKIEKIIMPEARLDLSTEDILVMTFIEGTPFNRYEFNNQEREELSRIGIKVMLKQILDDGLFHADPHAGNLIYTKDKKISYIDFGMTGRLSKSMRNQLIDLLFAIYVKEAEWVLREILVMGEIKDEIDTKALARDLMEVIDRYTDRSIRDISLGRAFLEIFDIIRNYQIILDPAYAVVVKTMVTAEKTARDLNDKVNILEVISWQLKRLFITKNEPKNLLLNMSLYAKDVYRLLGELPVQLREILKKLKSGQLEIEFKHVGLENLIHTLDRISNRIAFSLIIASLIVGSSIIMILKPEPLFFGIPIFGFLGYVFASLLGIWLLFSIIRSGRL
jgi:ubiquinone biosynthesis protein